MEGRLNSEKQVDTLHMQLHMHAHASSKRERGRRYSTPHGQVACFRTMCRWGRVEENGRNTATCWKHGLRFAVIWMPPTSSTRVLWSERRVPLLLEGHPGTSSKLTRTLAADGRSTLYFRPRNWRARNIGWLLGRLCLESQRGKSTEGGIFSGPQISIPESQLCIIPDLYPIHRTTSHARNNVEVLPRARSWRTMQSLHQIFCRYCRHSLS